MNTQTRRTNLGWGALWLTSLAILLLGLATKQSSIALAGGVGVLASIVALWRRF